MVYFVQAENGGLVKIGTANNPVDRLAELQTGSPVKLKLLGIIEGDSEKEKNLHDKFKAERMHGEWFSLSTELSSYLNSVCHIKPIQNNIDSTSMYINEKLAAEIMCFSVQTLRNWRHNRKGPNYYKVGRRVIYNVYEIKQFMESNHIIIE